MDGKLSLITAMLFFLHVCKALRPMWSPASRALNLRSNKIIRECSLPRNYAKETGLFLSKKRNDSNRPKCRMLNDVVSDFDKSKFPRPLKGVLFDMDVSFERLYFVKLDDARNINNICREHCLTLSPCTGEHMPMYLCGKCRRFPPILFLGNITTRIWAVEQRRVKNRLDSTRATDTLTGLLRDLQLGHLLLCTSGCTSGGPTLCRRCCSCGGQRVPCDVAQWRRAGAV